MSGICSPSRTDWSICMDRVTPPGMPGAIAPPEPLPRPTVMIGPWINHGLCVGVEAVYRQGGGPSLAHCSRAGPSMRLMGWGRRVFVSYAAAVKLEVVTMTARSQWWMSR